MNFRNFTVPVLILISAVISFWLYSTDESTLHSLLDKNNYDTISSYTLLFAFLCLISQLLIIPSGSLLLMAGGWALGAMPATLIYSVLQLVTAIPVLWAGEKFQASWNAKLEKKSFHKHITLLASVLKSAPLTLSLTLRLTPIIPSALACLMSNAFGIPNRIFLLATVLVCWIRPLFFANIGATLAQLNDNFTMGEALTLKSLAPLIVAFAAAVLLLCIKLWINYSTGRWQADMGDNTTAKEKLLVSRHTEGK